MLKAELKKRGDKPGLVWIFSALEPCTSYRPWRDHATQRTYLRCDDGKCLHYYFYFIDEEWELCYVRVPTCCPFRLQFYCNAHNWLAGQLRRHRIAFRMCDNALVEIADWSKAQQLADGCKPKGSAPPTPAPARGGEYASGRDGTRPLRAHVTLFGC